MSDPTADHQQPTSKPSTIADALVGLVPIGDLSRFAIDDLSPADEDQFFRILEGA